MKKIIAFVLSVVLLLFNFSVTSFAVAEQPETFKAAMYNAVFNMEEEVDISEFHVGLSEVQEYYYLMKWQHPELYYFDYIGDIKGTQDGIIRTLSFNYKISKEKMLSERKFIEEETDKLINKIGKDWSELEKALYVHDWLDVNFMYDYRLFEGLGSENHDILGFLRDKIGVCQSYAYTYMYILRRLGMNCYYVISEVDNHGWNVVEIDGKWYHVDATYDDPILGPTYDYDYVGEVRHNKFLLSDSEIIADGDHDDFYIPKVEGIVCESFTGNDSWRTATTAVHKIGEYWYYIDNSKNAGGFMRTKDFKNTEKLMDIGIYNEKYDVYGWEVGGGVYNCYFAGLFEYNGHIFFNTEKEIYVYDSHHNVFKAIPIDRPEGKTYYGLNMDGKTITYLASADSLLENVVEGSYTLGLEIVHLPTDWEIIEEPTQTEDGLRVKYCFFCADVVETQTIPALGDSALMGDADGNGNVNTTDLAVLKIFLANGNGEMNMRADFNKDGIINTTDLASLKLKLAGVN